MSNEKIILGTKIVSLVAGMVIVIFFDEVITFSERSFALPLSMFLENLIFVSSFSPMGLLSVFAAKHVLVEGNYIILTLGYVAAALANLISYALGSISRRGDKSVHEPAVRFMFTYWHPGLAAVAAFTEGVEGRGVVSFLRHAVIWSSFYYLIACLVILYVPFDVRSPIVAYLGFFGLIFWILLPYSRKK